MLRTILGCMGIALAGASYLQAGSQEASSPATQPASPQRVLLNRYCVTCHNEKLKTANLMLDKMDVEDVSEGAAVWEKVVRKLQGRAMPPAGMPRPDNATYDSFVTYMETALDRAATAKPNPGRPVIHRLNRTEYGNAIRDLLAIDIDAGSLLPADETAYGFDNNADALAVSPVLLERYMSAAKKISRLAIGDIAIPPAVETYYVPEDFVQEDRVSEDLPFGSRGGIVIHHYFPLDGDYVLKILLQRDSEEAILGVDKLHQVDVLLDGARIELFTVGGERNGKSAEEYERTADAVLEIRIPARAGAHVVGVTFLKDTLKPDGAGFFRQGVASVTIGGPYGATAPGELPSRARIFVCLPTGSWDEDPCAKKILSTLARRAYRRPVTDADVQPLLGLYKVGRSKGGFEAGIMLALREMLVSPGFLFRVEHDPPNVAPDTAYRISDLELASRLSFFLWSSIPDDELLELAERGKLKYPAVLEQQVRRMLRDSRSKALVSNFGGQWLYLRNMRMKVPDAAVFRDFDENLRQALQQETELFFESNMREDRSVLDLLNADYTFLNERLARHYGIPNIYGSRFRRVTLTDENRKGLLGQGSILAVTSYNTRTAPTLRGKWLLENILGAPPPPPPPNVPSLKDDKDAKALTMRQRMEQHRANPACASCHKVMDPLGFALENFDAIGRYRTTDGKTLIDASGELPDGTKFAGPAGLRNVLLGKSEQFVATVIEKLLTYAVGREIEYYDMPAIRKITLEAAPDHRWSALIMGIVKSAPFQMRKAQEPASAAGLR
ncbi:MAG: DUF1592 domain-containing protein [Acidobacteria bacterium]|nr:DUF1592 domain-containing protein [Acidobacteriota bacterium]